MASLPVPRVSPQPDRPAWLVRPAPFAGISQAIYTVGRVGAALIGGRS